MSVQRETLFFQNGDVQIHAVAAGSPDAPVVILLHGFPEFWYGWHRQIEPLSSAGFRVIVPDQRGYNRSSKPADVRSYAISELASDVIAIADALGGGQIFLAGHDWGAAVAWSLALRHPQRIAKLAILNVPHPTVMGHYLKANRRQLRRSWYMFFFQIPFLPEAILSANNFRVGVSALLRTSKPGTFSDEDFAEYRKAWSQPGATTAMINWYRAAFRTRPRPSDPTVRVPTLILWGQNDRFLLSEMAEESARLCMNAKLIPFPDATHWLQHEEPVRVSELLIEFFQRG